MGKSKSIADLEKKEDEYRGYLTKLENELEARAATYKSKMESDIHAYYTQNGWKVENFISGQNSDFMQKSEWSLANVKAIIDQIGKAIFGGGGSLPDGVTMQKTEDLSKALGEMENMELYVVGKAFEVLSGIVESFGSASSVSFNSNSKSVALGNGLHLFATVVCDSYKSTSFFENEEIYEYLYIYEVKFSHEEAEAQASMELTKLYEDQITTFTQKVEDLLTQLESDAITAEQYQSSSQIYNTLISASKKQLSELEGNH